MRILILCHAFNSLSQRVFAELAAAGHEVSVEFDISDEVTREAVALFEPDVIVAPFLKRRIPDEVWRAVPCLIVHPGPPGDRGPNALDWAVLEGKPEWGVSIIRATGELDGGPVLAYRMFPMRHARKSSLYRFEVTEAAVAALAEGLAMALGRIDAPAAPPDTTTWRGAVPKGLRRIDWQADDSETILRKIMSADGQPGASAVLAGLNVRLFDARPEPGVSGRPGTLMARSGGAVLVGARGGALWIGKLRLEGDKQFKRRAVDVLVEHAAPEAQATSLPEWPPEPFAEPGRGPVRYREHGNVGVLEFDYYNGAMSTGDCAELLPVFNEIRSRPVRVIVLAGGSDFWSNGMDLNTIEASMSAADESWANINAIDDLAEAIIRTTDKLTVSALAGNAAAGGVFLALAADEVWARDGIVLNPHYKNMGNLYGSEFWTYLLPKRVGEAGVEAVMGHRLPMLGRQAESLGLVDAVGPNDARRFRAWALERAGRLADRGWEDAITFKKNNLLAEEQDKLLEAWRAVELERMKMNFYGFDPSYHVARYRLVQRTPHAWTPLYLARHRCIGAETRNSIETADERR
ncbi:MAG: enoyl-CoA hydratase-related protein [Wenzhouxiangellaceae bacterium]|nr:enoyl-CoA hydratase-related protein [Wenzhouxiangellaceae bacterium]